MEKNVKIMLEPLLKLLFGMEVDGPILYIYIYEVFLNGFTIGLTINKHIHKTKKPHISILLVNTL